jgi:hypothetical protein
MTNVIATSTSRRFGGVGHSEAADAAAAGRDAVRSALAGRRAGAGDLVIIFPSAGYDLAALHAAALEAAAPASVVGASGTGSFTHQGQLEHGCAAAWIPADEMAFGICHVSHGEGRTAAATREAAELARARAGERHPHSVLMLLTDGLTDDQREVARGASEVTGAMVPIVGGAAGDDLRWAETVTFGEGVTRTDGIVAVWINAARPLAVSVDHGWRPTGIPMLVTRSDGTVIRELDGRPALDAYLEEAGSDLDPAAPDFLVQVLQRPLGLPNARGRYDVRQLHALLPEGRGINFNVGVPEQTAVQVMLSDTESLLDGARRAAAAAADQLGDDGRLALVFSCASRVPLLADRAQEEIDVISAGLRGIPACGFYTFGEFGRTLGSTGVHNSSVAILAF